MSLRTLNKYYAPLTIRLGSDKMLWKAHTSINGKEIQYYYRPFSLDSYIKKEIFEMNAYNVKPELYENSTVLDLGAHIGLYSLLADCFAKEVISFEPDIRNYRLFRLNQSINQTSISIYQQAIDGTQLPEVGLRTYNNAGNSTLIPFPFGKVKVKNVPNVDINDFFPTDIVKIDIEGSEYDVINSIENMNNIKKAFTIEVHYHVPEWKSKLHNMIKKLNDNGFKVEWIKKYSYNGHIYAERI